VQGIGHTLFRLGQVLESEGRAQAARDRYLESLLVLDRSNDRWGIAQVLDALGRLSVTTGEHERGACLLGAAEALCERIGAHVLPRERRDDPGPASTVLRVLGQSAFDTAWADGRALRLDQAVAFARSPAGG
jgi:hypothetical protein